MLAQSLKSLPRHYRYIAQSERYGDDIKGIAYAVETVQDHCRSHVEGTHYSPPVGRDPGLESDAYSASNSVPSTALSSTALPDGTTTCPQHSALKRQVDTKVGSCQYFCSEKSYRQDASRKDSSWSSYAETKADSRTDSSRTHHKNRSNQALDSVEKDAFRCLYKCGCMGYSITHVSWGADDR